MSKWEFNNPTKDYGDIVTYLPKSDLSIVCNGELKIIMIELFSKQGEVIVEKMRKRFNRILASQKYKETFNQDGWIQWTKKYSDIKDITSEAKVWNEVAQAYNGEDIPKENIEQIRNLFINSLNESTKSSKSTLSFSEFYQEKINESLVFKDEKYKKTVMPNHAMVVLDAKGNAFRSSEFSKNSIKHIKKAQLNEYKKGGVTFHVLSENDFDLFKNFLELDVESEKKGYNSKDWKEYGKGEGVYLNYDDVITDVEIRFSLTTDLDKNETYRDGSWGMTVRKNKESEIDDKELKKICKGEGYLKTDWGYRLKGEKDDLNKVLKILGVKEFYTKDYLKESESTKEDSLQEIIQELSLTKETNYFKGLKIETRDNGWEITTVEEVPKMLGFVKKGKDNRVTKKQVAVILLDNETYFMENIPWEEDIVDRSHSYNHWLLKRNVNEWKGFDALFLDSLSKMLWHRGSDGEIEPNIEKMGNVIDILADYYDIDKKEDELSKIIKKWQ